MNQPGTPGKGALGGAPVTLRTAPAGAGPTLDGPLIRYRALATRHLSPQYRAVAGESIPADLLIELVRGGLVAARSERIDDEDGAIEVTRVWITEAGERVLAART